MKYLTCIYTISQNTETLISEVSIDHLVTIKCSAGDPWVLVFMWTSPHGNSTPWWQCPPTGQCTCNTTETAQAWLDEPDKELKELNWLLNWIDTLSSFSCSLHCPWALFAVMQPLPSVFAMSGLTWSASCLGEWCSSNRCPREGLDSRFSSRKWHCPN